MKTHVIEIFKRLALAGSLERGVTSGTGWEKPSIIAFRTTFKTTRNKDTYENCMCKVKGENNFLRGGE